VVDFSNLSNPLGSKLEETQKLASEILQIIVTVEVLCHYRLLLNIKPA
jgi:hypothetical protein